ncbi:hypothetical protein GCM10027275_08940 [Rhabdobacter roseus]|uniref:asparagine synthase (glutamine-hydrolyzing) n=1 Tax=Rhabdobacter roseus TaxID=1655419 RepID=A0A840TH53_9BACT|nr:asparagine synthase-related protein [Rhabdobacter roseus]MBB5282794.1 asparagine synthase (glutamine-hydrolyzing) [Rhabdobacter roseus]
MTQLSDFSGIIYFEAEKAWQAEQIGPAGEGNAFAEGSLATTHPEALAVTESRVVLALLGTQNRQVLQGRLLTRTTHDAELVSLAFQQWGEGLAEVLTGAFVVVIWERKTKILRVIRDRFGFIPLYYQHVPGVSFAFANRMAALPDFKKSRSAIDRHKVRQYLTLPASYQSPEDRTFYQNVKAALPAHLLRVQDGKLTTKPYWNPRPDLYQSLIRDDDYMELFREYFVQSVGTCVAEHTRVGTHLSGGLDSSSVACVAHRYTDQLSTFYVNPALPSTDETFFVKSVVDQIHSRHYETPPRANVYESIYLISTLFDRPEHFITPSSFHLAAAEKIHEAGCEVVLTGHDGDSVVDNGNSLIQTYRRTQDWPRLKWALGAFASHRDLSYLRPGWLEMPPAEKQRRYTDYYLSNELWQLLKQKNIQAWLSTALSARRELGYSYTTFLAFAAERLWDKTQASTIDTLLTDDLRNGPGTLDDRLTGDDLYTAIHADFLTQFRAITNRGYVDATEQMYHMGRHYGHRYAHPFFDEKLVELSLAIPEKLKFGDGAGRDTIRRALQGTLPEAVRRRGFKTSFSEYGLVTFRQLYQHTQDLFTNNHPLWEWVDKKKFDHMKEVLLNDKVPLYHKSKYNTLANKALYLGVWLQQLQDGEKI